MLKKTAWLVTLAMLLALAACQETTQPDNSGTTTATENPPAAQSTPAEDEPEAEPPPRNFARLGETRGLLGKTSAATPGYVLFASLKDANVYLIDTDGQVVHTWESKYTPGSIYLRDNGNLVLIARDAAAPVFAGGGQAGWFLEYTWDGELVWQYHFSSTDYLSHHDIAIMPNGNILAIAWEAKTVDQAIAAGRNPELIPKAGLWPDWIVEIQPQGSNDAKIVWEWHFWDHLVQDFDASKDNFAVVADHPELLDVNSGEIPEPITQEQLDQRKAADFASTNDTIDNNGSDIYHTNSINYNAELDQIAISAPHLHEIFIIDHSTTTTEAAGHEGGRSGKGGDFLYRWGNPANYDRGDELAQVLDGQHDLRWIPAGYPGAGNLLVFNNNVHGAKPGYSAVLELQTPLTDTGYELSSTGVYGPEEPAWSYVPEDPMAFFSPFISGARRLANGNTLITEGASGRFFEVDAEGNVLWNYMTPYTGDRRNPDGTSPQPVGPFIYATFRATHIPADHPATAGKNLAPLDPQPPVYKPPEK